MVFHEHLVSLLLEGYTTGQQLRTVINYLVHAGNSVDHGALIRLLAKKAPQHKGILMTIAEQLRQEGHGKGVVQGRNEATIRIALAMLNQGMERAQIIQLTGLSEEALDALASS